MENPYQTPESNLVDEKPAEFTLAGRGSRLAAAIIDGIIGLVFAIPVIMSLGIWDMAKAGQQPPFSLTLLSAIIGFAAFALVHGYFLNSNGQTIGKKLLGIRIAKLDHAVPPLTTTLGKRYLPITLASLVPMVGQILTIVDILFIFRGDRRCVHDHVAGTQVIKA